jgi:drug/metabolite transporter (DMT)-like permease
MLHIILAVLTGVLVLVIFKLFPRFSVNVFPAIIFNYITAAITGYVLDEDFSFSEVLYSSWLPLTLPLGAFFISIFYLISLTAQKIGISTASIATKMSVVMPVLFSVFFLHQHLTVLKVAGIALALLAVYLSSRQKENPENSAGLVWLPVLVFVGSGAIDVSINAANAYYLDGEAESARFTVCTFFSAFVCGMASLLILIPLGKVRTKGFFTLRNILAGIALGIPNFFSIYFIFRALDGDQLKSSELFPVLNLSNVILSALAAWLFFKERISLINLAGIVLAIISIILIAL